MRSVGRRSGVVCVRGAESESVWYALDRGVPPSVYVHNRHLYNSHIKNESQLQCSIISLLAKRTKFDFKVHLALLVEYNTYILVRSSNACFFYFSLDAHSSARTYMQYNKCRHVTIWYKLEYRNKYLNLICKLVYHPQFCIHYWA